jgi:serine/threonine protein kinase
LGGPCARKCSVFWSGKRSEHLREAKVHARLNHPNIVSFCHATQLDGQLVITAELVEGTTLAQRRESGLQPLAEALSYIS